MGLMEGLSHWLRQIIAVVLLAAIIDMILPNRTMQKYVRLVAGLFILMTVATPIMQWVKGDFTHQLTESLNAVDYSPQHSSNELARIEEEGSKLRDKHKAQAATLVAQNLEEAITSEVENHEQRAVQDVTVQLQQEADGSLTVTEVMILLGPQSPAAHKLTAAIEVKEVDLIESVDIQIEVNKRPLMEDESAVPVIALETQEEVAIVDKEDKAIQNRVSALIASRFGIPSPFVKVKQNIDLASPN